MSLRSIRDPIPTSKSTTPPNIRDKRPIYKNSNLPDTRDPIPTYNPTTLPSTQESGTSNPTTLRNIRDPSPNYKSTTLPSFRIQNSIYKPIALPSIRQLNPTYNPSTQNPNHEDQIRNPSPTYPQTAPMHQQDNSAGLSPNTAGHNTRIQQNTATHLQDSEHTLRQNNNGEDPSTRPLTVTRLIHDETASTSASSEGNARIQPHAATSQNSALSQPGNANDPCHRQQPVTSKKTDAVAVKTAKREAALRQDDGADNLFIQPYAVRYQEEDDDSNRHAPDGTENTRVENTDGDIEPYVAYMGQGGVQFVKRRSEGSSERPVLSTSLEEEESVGNDADTSCSVRNDGATLADQLNPNPMYLPNIGQQLICGAFLDCLCLYSRVCRRHAGTVIFLIVLLVSFTFAGLYFTGRAGDVQKSTPGVYNVSTPAHSILDTASSRDQHTRRYSAEGSTMATVISDGSIKSSYTPTVPKTSASSQGTPGVMEGSIKLIFGGKGSEPGRFDRNYGVALSAENEIFVTDFLNKRVQVFSTDGAFLRLFPTVVPGGGPKIQPCGTAIDGEGDVWVVGYTGEVRIRLQVAQYNKNGLPLTTFDLQHWAPSPSIAIDLRKGRIIVGDLREIFILRPNGSVYRRFGAEKSWEFSYVTTDQEGNILVTDTKESTVHVYNSSGQWRFTFGGFGYSEGKLVRPRGICVDTSGNILVADWGNRQIDMFTSRGEFVRTVATTKHPWGIALGPDGQMVVTNVQDNTVTIFPGQVARM